MPLEFHPYTFQTGYSRKTTAIHETLKTFWDNAIDYGVWQNDCIEQIPNTAKIVVYPNEEPITPKIAADLESLRNRGVTVYTGLDKGYLENATGPANDFQLPMYCIFRDTGIGRLSVIISKNTSIELGKSAHSFSAIHTSQSCDLNAIGKMCNCSYDDGHITFTGGDYNLLLTDGKAVKMAQVYGRLAVGGTFVSDSAGKKYIIKSIDGISLEKSKDLLLAAYGPCDITVAGRFTSAHVLDGETKLAELAVSHDGEKTIVHFTREELSYAVRLRP
jgi:hypothetical protein